ncbi:hypothetical protein SAMN05444157_0420 [Frankineae bacterium MT45]|nr:hypothetical protein SAMN05444157_0420 [Frankineae bacterium MT45]
MNVLLTFPPEVDDVRHVVSGQESADWFDELHRDVFI